MRVLGRASPRRLDHDPDNDCSGAADEAFDADGDGTFDADDCASSGYPDSLLDCDDGDATINPGAGEAICDGLDSDCDGVIDDATVCEAAATSAGLSCIFEDTGSIANLPMDPYDEGSFLYCATPLPHPQALDACDALGYSLTSLDKMGDTGVVGNGPGAALIWWTSGADPQSDGLYEWGPGEPITVGPWATGTPPTAAGLCVFLERDTGTQPPQAWDVQDCTTPAAFVCEALLEP